MSEHPEMSSGPTPPPIACSAAGKRMRLHRKRRRLGLRCLTIELRKTRARGFEPNPPQRMAISGAGVKPPMRWPGRW
jgi:hypothetical protein